MRISDWSSDVCSSDLSTAFRLARQNPNIVFVPPATGALGWIDSFALPRKGEADEAAYKWINFVLQPEIVKLMSASTGGTAAVKGGRDLLPEDKKAAFNAAFTVSDLSNLKFFANIPPCVDDRKSVESAKRV